MKPRVFISSTYYDLKYIRESLHRFVQSFGFEPILFEHGNVTFEHGKPLDESCYNEVNTCHMMVLIIGGRYGSAATDEQNTKQGMDDYEKNYVSVTRRECETAMKNNLPIFIFIEKGVFADYENYIQNRKLIDKAGTDYKFAHADNVNIFKFIDAINKQPIKTFEKIEDIEEYLRQQLSGMFFQYLQMLKNKSQNERLLDAVNEINNITHRMNMMLQKVGEKVIDKEEYDEVVDEQFRIVIDNYISLIDSYVNIISIKISEDKVKDVAKFASNEIFKLIASKDIKHYIIEGTSFYEKLYKNGINLRINTIRFYFDFRNTIAPFISKDPKLKDYFLTELESTIYTLIMNDNEIDTE